MMKLWIVLVFLAFIALPAHAATDKDLVNTEIVIAPRPHEDLAGFPFEKSDTYYFVKTASRIFFQATPISAKIIETDIGSDKAEFTLSNPKYGDGTIQLFSTANLKKVSTEEITQVLIRSLSDDKISLVVADTKTKKLHLATSNHLPIEGDRVYLPYASAAKAGFRECGVCFSKHLFTPDYATEIALQKKGEAELRHFNDHLNDPELQSRVEKIGKKILSRWPYPLVGYTYRFTVVQSEDINAFALAAGSLYLTSGLLKAVENDDELEAVMAHEIAHVERQHGLQAYKNAISNQQTQAALQILGGIAAGVAVANNRNTAAGVIGGATVASIIAIRLQELGFSKEQERDADDFAVRYFNKAGSSLGPLRAIFKKLMYHNLCSRLTPDPSSVSHPALGSRLASLESKRTTFPSAKYHLFIDNKPLEVTILSSSSNDEGTDIVMYLSDLAVLKELLNGSEELRLNSASRAFAFTIDDGYVYSDPWGGMITARTKDPLPTLPTFDSVGNVVYINMNSGKPATSQDPNAYPETRKRKLLQGSFY